MGSSRWLSESAHCQWPHFGDPLIVLVDVPDAESVVQGGFGDEQVGDRDPVSHPVMMRQILLEQ
ncbi:MAG: hypothetical protein ACYCO3_12770 [Mycobacteriales bacterium]